MAINSFKSNALEPTRTELRQLPLAARLMRLLPVYGLVILTVLLALFFSLVLPDDVSDPAQRPLDHLRQVDHRHSLACGDDPDGDRQDRPDDRLRDRALAHPGDQPAGMVRRSLAAGGSDRAVSRRGWSGLFNGLLVEVAQIDSFIATLGTGTVLYAIAMWHSQGPPDHGRAARRVHRRSATRGCSACRSPASMSWCCRSSLWFILEYLPIGRYLYAIGANPEGGGAERHSGPPLHCRSPSSPRAC